MHKLEKMGRKLALPLLALCLAFFAAAPAKAATDIWENINPPALSGTISAIGAIGEYVYLGTSQGIYKSSDYGQSWALTNAGLSDFNVSSIAIGWVYGAPYTYAPDTPVYLGTADGVFVSTLSSTTWSQLPETNNLAVNDLKIDQYRELGANPSTLYMATTTAGGLYRSDNAGVNWTIQAAGLSGETTKKLITDLIGGKIFAVTDTNKIFATDMYSVGSVNENWVEAYATTTAINSISNNNSNGLIQYLSTDSGLFRSTDNGANWEDWNGTTTTRLSDPYIRAMTTDYGPLQVAFAAGQGGAYFSVTNNSSLIGNVWNNANKGMGNVSLIDIVTNPASSTCVYAIGTTSAYRVIFSDINNDMALSLLSVNDTVSPETISGLSSNGAGTSTMELQWQAVGDDGLVGQATGYDLRYSTSTIDEANWNVATQAIGEPSPTTSLAWETFTVTGLVPDSRYYFAVKAIDEVGNASAISNIASASTSPLGDAENPTTPLGMAISSASTTYVSLSWSSSTDNIGVIGYKVYRATTTGALSQIGTTSAINYTDTSAAPLTVYIYGVGAYDSAGNTSPMSATTSTSTLPVAPSGFTASAVSTSGINLSWTATAGDVAYYIVYRGGTQIATTTNTSYSDTGLSASTAYSYGLRVYSGSGHLSAAAAASATTQANQVSGGGGGGGGGSISLTCSSWTYSAWSACVNGQQTRTILTSSPSGCTGGSPVLTLSCTASASTTATTTSSSSGTAATTTASGATATGAQDAPADTDKDGLLNDFEQALGTDPLKADSDGDGFSDKDELQKDFSPVSAGKKMAIDPVFTKKHQGKVFLQVDKKGQAWYVNPKDLKRYYLGRPSNAFEVMRRQGLGVRHEVIEKTKVYPARLVGRILIDVEDKGRAYYINPKDAKAYYLGRPADAFEIMRRLGVGITSINLDKIAVGF